MVFVGFEGTAKAFHFDAADGVSHLALVQDGPALLLHEIEQLVEIDYARTQIGLELGGAGENDEALEGGFGEFEECLDSFDVAEILVKWILKPALYPVNNLRPVTLVRFAENPAGIILCLDHEDAGLGYQNMVNFGCSSFGGEGHFVYQNVAAR